MERTEKQKEVLIDISPILLADLHTGVQRVEVNLSKALISPEHKITPVCQVSPSSWKTFVTDGALMNPTAQWLLSIYIRLHQPFRLKRLFVGLMPTIQAKKRLLGLWGSYTKFLLLPVLTIVLILLALPAWLYSTLRLKPKTWEPRKNQQLLVMNTCWADRYRYNYSELKKCGVGCYFFMHDLIPVTHPHFFTAEHTTEFADILKNAIRGAQGFVTNSVATSHSLEGFLQASSEADSSHYHIQNIRIGFKLYRQRASGNVRDVLRSIFEKHSCFISVGTIEPRKNHSFTVSVFDRLWEDVDTDKCLILIGGYGWNEQAFTTQVLNHPELNKRLYWFNDLNDEELAYCYERALALVNASVIEGYGLPILEARSFNCPCILNDIEVFKEVSDQHAKFFSIDSPCSLLEHLLTTSKRDTRPYNDFSPPKWDDSAHDTLTILRGAKGETGHK